MPGKAAKKSAAKKPAKKSAARKAVKFKKDARTERLVVEAVTALRDNPDRYRELRNSLAKAKSDKERAKQLLDYATTDRDLASLLPGGGGETALVTWTTVTVTTVTFFDAPIKQQRS